MVDVSCELEIYPAVPKPLTVEEKVKGLAEFVKINSVVETSDAVEI